MKLLKRLFRKKKPEQSTFIFCPMCDNELVKNGRLVSDGFKTVYECSKCKYESKWLLDPPVPILVLGGTYEDLLKEKEKNYNNLNRLD